METSRNLLREIIEHYQTHEPAALASTGLLRILVHVVNIQKMVEAATEDPTNAVRRLVDFSNTIERLKLPTAEGVDIEPIRRQLIEALRLASEQLRPRPGVESWSAEQVSAPAL